jgi:hypothetical protein
MGAPPGQPIIADGLALMPGIADIMIAGNRAKANTEATHHLGRIPHVVLDIGAVDRDVAGMDDEIGALPGDPHRERRPIIREMPLAGAQMRVGDLNYSHSAPHRKVPTSGIRANTREQPAAISRSAWSMGQ